MKKIFIGIDFSQKTFDASCILPEERKPRYMRQYGNDPDGFQLLADDIHALESANGVCDTLICGENTGLYCMAFADSLSSNGFFVWIEHPASIRYSTGIHRNKTDKADSMMIAEYAMRFSDKAVRHTPDSDAMTSLRDLYRFREFLVKEKVRLSNEIKSCKASGKATAETTYVLGRLQDSLKDTLCKIKDVDSHILKSVSQDEGIKRNYDNITSIKGVSLVNAVNLIVRTDNFSKVFTSRQLMSYCGVAPFSHESGTSIHGPAKTGKLCRRRTKALLNTAAKCAIRFNEKYKDYYDGLISRGKDFRVAINNVCAKLLREIFALVTKGEPSKDSADKEKKQGTTTEVQNAA